MPNEFFRTSCGLKGDRALAWPLLAAGIICLGLWGLWFGLARITIWDVSSQARVETETMTRSLSSLSAGRVVFVNAAMGQGVKANDILVRLDTAGEDMRRDAAQMQTENLPSRQAELRAEISALQLAVQQSKRADLAAIASASFRAEAAGSRLDQATEASQRLTQESLSGAVSRLDVQQAVAQARQARADADDTQAEVARLNADSQMRTQTAMANIEARRRDLLALESQSQADVAHVAQMNEAIESQYVIRAPTDGRIGDIAPINVGSYVEVGQPLIKLVPYGDTLVRAGFSPDQVQGRMHVGQTALLEIEGYPWAQFGHVPARVAHVGTEVRDGLIWVDLLPDAKWRHSVMLRHGLAARVQVNIGQATPTALLLMLFGQTKTSGATL